MNRLGWVFLLIGAGGCISAVGELPEDEFGEVGLALTKGSGGASGVDVDFCNDPAFLCVAGEGDCDIDSQCQGSLVCGLDNGPQFGQPFAWDACVPAHCRNSILDGGETAVDCGGECGSICGVDCAGVEPSPGISSCTHDCPCAAGESDCDNDTQCNGGLVCGTDNGPQFGFPVAYDVCVEAHCANAVQDGDETGLDCGGEDCGACADACAGVPANGDPNHCTPSCPCPNTEGDCDSDADCTGGGVCTMDIGDSFGFHRAIDICLGSLCADGMQNGDEEGVDCGPSCRPCPGQVISIGGADHDRVAAIAVDAAGNTLMVGRFTNSLSLGGPVLIATGPSTTAADIFVVKHASDGTHLWSRQFGGNLSDGVFALNIAVGPMGEVAVSGDFNGVVDFGGGPVAANSADGFVMVLESNGTFRWAQTFGGAGIDSARAVDFDASGNVFATGQFTGSVDFGGGALVSGGDTDVFVVEYSGVGAHLRSHRYGGAGIGESGHDIVVDGSSLYVGGTYRGAAMFGAISTTSTAGSADAFLIQLSSTTLLPTNTLFFGGHNVEIVHSLAVANSSVTAVGRFGSTVDFGGGNVTTAGQDDGFVLNTSKALAFSWVTTVGGTGYDLCNGVDVNPGDGSIYVVGDMETNSSVSGTTTTGHGGRDSFLLHLTSAGAVVTVAREGGSGLDTGKDVSVNAGVVAYTGLYQNSATFSQVPFTSAGGLDIFRVVNPL